MKQVTKGEFYSVIGPQDIVVRPEKYKCSWETRGRMIVGITTPGYMCRDALGNYTDKKEYFLAE